jgi:hypothetical protein
VLALFFRSISLDTTASGLLAGLYSEETVVPYFAFRGITAIVLGVALAAATPAIRKGMSGVRQVPAGASAVRTHGVPSVRCGLYCVSISEDQGRSHDEPRR